MTAIDGAQGPLCSGRRRDRQSVHAPRRRSYRQSKFRQRGWSARIENPQRLSGRHRSRVKVLLKFTPLVYLVTLQRSFRGPVQDRDNGLFQHFRGIRHGLFNGLPRRAAPPDDENEAIDDTGCGASVRRGQEGRQVNDNIFVLVPCGPDDRGQRLSVAQDLYQSGGASNDQVIGRTWPIRVSLVCDRSRPRLSFDQQTSRGGVCQEREVRGHGARPLTGHGRNYANNHAMVSPKLKIHRNFDRADRRTESGCRSQGGITRQYARTVKLAELIRSLVQVKPRDAGQNADIVEPQQFRNFARPPEGRIDLFAREPDDQLCAIRRNDRQPGIAAGNGAGTGGRSDPGR